VGVSLYRIIPGGLLGIVAVAIGDGGVAALQTLAAFAVGLVLAIIWGTTLALALAATGVYLRDAILAAPILSLGAIFVSPLYVPDDSGILAAVLVNLNPLTIPMKLVLNGLSWISQHELEFALGVAVALLVLWAAAHAFRRLGKNFADYI
jgi:ABC-type polysaccharide/polyol phosphate export permease